MTRWLTIDALALAIAGFFPSCAAFADMPRPECVVRGKAGEEGLRIVLCDAVARHLAAAFPGLDPETVRLVLTRVSPRSVSGYIERVDGSGRGPDISVDAQDGPLDAADIDHFAQNALNLFLFR